jgi:signal transduction histidine kinase/integral membrane sensor domain MASE1
MNSLSFTGNKQVLTILVIAIAYFCASEFRYLFAFSTSFASLIFPSSGIALVGFLLFGYRVWPGVFLGNLLTNYLIIDTSGSQRGFYISLVSLLCIATGACLQAVVGNYLVKRFTDFPESFIKGKQLFSFLFYGGIVSGLVNATLSMSMFFLTGKVAFDEALMSWLTWWIGDALGVFIFTPLILLYFLKPLHECLGKQYFIMTLPVIALFLLTNLAIYYQNQYSQEKLRSEFNDSALSMMQALQVHLSNENMVGQSVNWSERVPQAFALLDTKDLSYRIEEQLGGVEVLNYQDKAAVSAPITWQQRLYSQINKADLSKVTTFTWDKRVWKLIIVSSNSWRFHHQNNITLFIILIGLMLDCLVVIYSWLVIVKEYQLQMTSNLRERALRQVQDELARRTQLEALVIEHIQDKVKLSQQIAHLDRQRSLGAMAFTLGHELKQPLTVVMINTEMAKLSLKEEVFDSIKLEMYLDRILVSADFINKILKKIKTYIRPSALEAESVDIAELVREAADFLKEDMLNNGVELHYIIEQRPLKVQGIAIELKQVLINLYRNALEALKDQPQRDIFITVSQQHAFVNITVQDTGPGMSEAVLKQIGSPFYTTKQEGMGLGLSICKNIIEQQGGVLVIANAEMCGASFIVRLPVG